MAKETCDATASGTETGDFTWIFVRPDDLMPMQLTFCAHHNAKHAAALRKAGWSPYSYSETENIPEPVQV